MPESVIAKITQRLSKWDGLDSDSAYTQMMRVTKVGEEYGEACEAIIAYHNVNPRKPAGPLEDVIKELCDCALSAKIAIENFGFNSEDELAHRELMVYYRMLGKADA